ncbi:MAG: SUMF1/EgtB/PvdO family nonheme iron enzyme [Planctomycetes bacterium]|nr:SUMF1/EgtB/PvdO family nonheme iron enzyme [Planctomycetota bacterium]
MSTFQILHISDLHVNSKEDFDRSVVLDPLISRVKIDRQQSDLKPEIVVVTGDVAYAGIKPEYESAKKFFDDLLEALKLSQDKLFIVPGNHDVYRKKYRPSEIPSFENVRALNEELENEEYRKDLFKGMEDYFNFIEKNYPHLKSKHGRLVPFVALYNAGCKKRIGLMGLNSAWMCRRSPDEREIAIGEYQVIKAMDELKETGEADLIINVFHHPMTWLWPVDSKINKIYFNNSILLSGHLHDAEGGYYEYLDGSIYQFQAGGAYVGSESSYPNRFQYITFNWGKNELRLDFRKFAKEERKWCIEAEKGDDGKKIFPMYGTRKKGGETGVSIPVIPETYRTWLSGNCAYMDIDKLRGKSEVIQVKMPEIFVPLFAYTPGEKTRNKQRLEEKEMPVDIEVLIKKNECLLIEGHPGSGKTTLLKHLAYGFVQNSPQAQRLDEWLPILLFLKDLKGFFTGKDGAEPSPSTAEEILAFYCDKAENGLNLEIIKAFCRAKRMLFLLDGLDEIDEKQRAVVVHSFANFKTQNAGNKLVLSGRPHGVADAASDRFGENHVKILPLNMEQTEMFIRNWFRCVYSEGSRIGVKNAEGMISEIRAHPSIEKFIDNPLMLTAICILYHDGKELPGQRAELYSKFIENLLYRRFPDYEKIREFLMTLAFDMHYSRRTKGIDRKDAMEVLKGVHKKQDKETEDSYRKRIEKLFDEIEPRCGLLKFENGQYLFWHLTFQEFMTAVYVKDNDNYEETIRQKWGEDWYNEVIELYIGYQSITDRKKANEIVGEIIQAEDGAPFKRWLLASKSMIDIHKDRRNDDVLGKVRERLLSIIDTDGEPKVRAEAGDILGWLGDTRDLKEFIRVKDGKYSVSVGKVTLKNFEIGKYPVTNSWFEEFVKAGGYKNKDFWTEEGKKWLDTKKAEYPRLWNERKWKSPNSPVVGVSWYEAYAFTRWLTALVNDGFEYRLPDENEWEGAASGLEKREYPWGNGWDKMRCNNYEINLEKTSPVGIFKKGDTPEGISDMAGNIWEWMDSWYDKEQTGRVLRGGSWYSGGGRGCRCASRGRGDSDGRVGDVGFRCARTLKL